MTVDRQTIAPAPLVSDSIPPLLVDSRRASRLCGISRSSWYSLLSAGRIGPPTIKLNGRCLYSVSDLTEWVASRNPETGLLPTREQWIARQRPEGAKRCL